MTDNKYTVSERSDIIKECHDFGVIVDSREIFLTGDLSQPDHDEIDVASANQFIRNLTLLNNCGNSAILVHLLSSGGCWNYGMAIYNAIKASADDPKQSDIVILAYGCVASMASIIPQAANLRIIMPDATFMMHYGSFAVSDSHQVAESAMNWSKKHDIPRMLQIYIDKCKEGSKFEGWTDNKITKYLKEQLAYKQDVYLTSKDSVEYGLMDGILGEEGFENISKLRA